MYPQILQDVMLKPQFTVTMKAHMLPVEETAPRIGQAMKREGRFRLGKGLFAFTKDNSWFYKKHIKKTMNYWINNNNYDIYKVGSRSMLLKLYWLWARN